MTGICLSEARLTILCFISSVVEILRSFFLQRPSTSIVVRLPPAKLNSVRVQTIVLPYDIIDIGQSNENSTLEII